jgi:hypothetical protein
MGGRRGSFWVFVGRHEGKSLLGRPRNRREGTIKILL